MEENNTKIDELLEQNMSYEEIADLLGIDLIDVINYVEEKRGKSVFGTRPNIIKRRKAVYELVRKKKTSGEIASDLGISIITVENDMVFLRKQGLIESRGTKQEQKEKR